MNIHKFKQEQFDDANALVNISSCNLLRMCAHPLLDPSCWILNAFVHQRNDSWCTSNKSNSNRLTLPTFSRVSEVLQNNFISSNRTSWFRNSEFMISKLMFVVERRVSSIQLHNYSMIIQEPTTERESSRVWYIRLIMFADYLLDMCSQRSVLLVRFEGISRIMQDRTRCVTCS